MSSPETRVLDGLRALAALLVVMYHFVDASRGHITLFGRNADYLWVYGETGVHLFFILSGFLLFMPYVKAMRAGRPLPSIRRFYTRRALRILPAYFICLVLLVAVQYPALLAQEGVTGLSADVILHVLMLHNLSIAFNRTINGPFWTLAIEWQFYLVLPLIAWVIALFVGPTRSTARIIYGVLGMIILALDARVFDGVIETAVLPQLQETHARMASIIDFAMLLLTGVQGRFLEVFATGMLCSVIYIVCIERKPRWLSRQRAAILSVSLLAVALTLSHTMAGYAQALGNTVLSPYYSAIDPTSWLQISGSFLIGLGYAAFVLGVLFSGAWLHWMFEFVPLRYIGLWSYSLYMWHGPALYGALPGTPNLTIPERLVVGAVITYLSYQLVERPFLQIRKREVAPATPKAAPAEPLAIEQIAARS
ncbi:MAG TPA: acyltransferase [Ktedonobacterales bacterium]|nr:acyltransferase [Ktedonobacterales bacterium]